MTQPPPGSLASGRVYLEMRKPDGSTCWVPLDNQSTYLAKGFVPTGQTADWDAWSVEAARRHKWHGFGPTYPGQSPTV